MEIQDSLTHASIAEGINSENGQNDPRPRDLEETLSVSSEASAGTAVTQQLVPPRCSVIVETKETAYGSMDTAEFIQAVFAQQSLDDLAKTVQRRLATSQDDAPLDAGSKDKSGDDWPGRHMWRINNDDHLLYNGHIYVADNAGLQTEVISRYHNDEFAGHFGHKRTAELAQQHYDWPGSSGSIKKYCRNCVPCQKGKSV